jgi:hypothetical protein
VLKRDCNTWARYWAMSAVVTVSEQIADWIELADFFKQSRHVSGLADSGETRAGR